uniref:Uncharacterized protein n=1 Tax=Meloidogyne enterolobii TaxID=390850 RepID=A0A6V7TQF5_MELEN|nr:unnamed protein product [Meloidogyne enterolobii]
MFSEIGQFFVDNIFALLVLFLFIVSCLIVGLVFWKYSLAEIRQFIYEHVCCLVVLLLVFIFCILIGIVWRYYFLQDHTKVDYYALALVKNDSLNKETLDSISTDTASKSALTFLYANSGVGLIILVIALFAFLLYFLNKKFEVFYDLVKEMEEVKPIVKSLNRKMDQNNSKGYLSVIRPQTRCQLNLIGFNFFMLEPMQIMLISFESPR